MKVNLFKKIGAIATATAMLASLCTVGYATGTEVKVNPNTGSLPAEQVTNGVIIGEQAKDAQGEDITGVYKVTIPYTTDETKHNIGITMLAFTQPVTKAQAPATEDTYGNINNTATSYTSSMQIVGVDQINKADFAGADEFTFYVDTNDSDSYWNNNDPDPNLTGAIRMKAGQMGLVLLSGDGVTAGAGAVLFTAAKAENPGFWNGDEGTNQVTTDAATYTINAVQDRPATGTSTELSIVAAAMAENNWKVGATAALASVIGTGADALAKVTGVTAVTGVGEGFVDAYSATNRASQKIKYNATVESPTHVTTTTPVIVTYEANPITAGSISVDNTPINDSDTSTETRALSWLTTQLTTTTAGLVDKYVTFTDSTDTSAKETYKIATTDFTGKFTLVPTLINGEAVTSATEDTVKNNDVITYKLTAASTDDDAYGETINALTASLETTFTVTFTKKEKWIASNPVLKTSSGEAVTDANYTLTSGMNEVAYTTVLDQAKDGVTSVTVSGTENGETVTDNSWTIKTETWKLYATDDQGVKTGEAYTTGNVGQGTYIAEVELDGSQSTLSKSDSTLYAQRKITVSPSTIVADTVTLAGVYNGIISAADGKAETAAEAEAIQTKIRSLDAKISKSGNDKTAEEITLVDVTVDGFTRVVKNENGAWVADTTGNSDVVQVTITFPVKKNTSNFELPASFTTTALIKVYLRGDIDNDGTLTGADCSLMIAHTEGVNEAAQITEANAVWRANIDGDSSLTGADCSLMIAHTEGVNEAAQIKQPAIAWPIPEPPAGE